MYLYRDCKLRRMADYDIQALRDIRLMPSTTQLLEQVDSRRAELHSYFPLSEEIGGQLQRALLPDRIVATLNLESIWVTRRQTLAVMDALRVGEQVGDSESEIANALAAHDFVLLMATNGTGLSLGLIREINLLVLQGIRADAGQIRNGDVRLSGASHVPPPGPAVSPLLDRLLEEFSRAPDAPPLLRAAWLHAQFTYIHPFSDGNGRTGRLLQDWCLLQQGYYPGCISPSRRDDYYAALESADHGSWDDIVELIATTEIEVVGKALSVVRENQKRKLFVGELARIASQKHSNTRHKQYLVWRRRMEDIRDTIKQLADDLRREASVLSLRLTEFDVIPFADWETMCKGLKLNQTWFFALNFYVDARPVYRVIAYLRPHLEQRHVDYFSRPSAPIGLYFTGSSEGRHDFSRYCDPDVRLRELLVDDTGTVLAYVADGDGRWDIDRALSAASAVQGLVSDVFMYKGGLAS